MAPSLRILITVAGVSAIALWPIAGWRWQVVPVGVLAALTAWRRMPLQPVARRAMVVWGLAALISLGLWGRPDWLLRAGNLFLKATLSLWALSLLIHTTPLPELLAGLRRLGVPSLWLGSLAFWGRYYAVLATEWERLQLARRSRSFSRNRALRFRVLANALGLLFVRAYERAEKVHRAMLARGYRGEL
ncbi:MAG: hypothetical protein D6766_05120 [Verrucomicrobia bacterium]|nr:MAG: hypothetical protein D6766_05120 [Verrucomicrobiota bacterium]